MTTDAGSSELDAAELDASALGRAAGLRFRRPGPPVGFTRRPMLVGRAAAAMAGFAASTGRSQSVRRALGWRRVNRAAIGW